MMYQIKVIENFLINFYLKQKYTTLEFRVLVTIYILNKKRDFHRDE